MGCYPSHFLVANPIWWSANLPFASVWISQGRKKPVSGLVLATEGTDAAPTLGSSLLQPVRAFLGALTASWSHSGLGFPTHSTFHARKRSWAGHPASHPSVLLPGEVGAVRALGAQGLSRRSWAWAENLSAAEKETGSCPQLGKIYLLSLILPLPTSAGTWPLI